MTEKILLVITDRVFQVFFRTVLMGRYPEDMVLSISSNELFNSLINLKPQPSKKIKIQRTQLPSLFPRRALGKSFNITTPVVEQ